MIQETFTVGNITFSNKSPLTVFAGPCALESREHALHMAHSLKEITDKLKMGFVYKTSFDKANRSSGSTPRGLGLEQSLAIFEEIRSTIGCPVMTDVHSVEQCDIVAEVVDILQIPAFLCRQTDLLVAAAKTNRALNIKKGQFLAPWDMKNIVQKVKNAGNNRIFVCERGTSFGYNTLVSDMRSLPILKETTGCPVVFDATHSVQQPGGLGEKSGGERQFVPILSRAAVAVGISTIFLETHQDPDNAPSDGPNMVFLKDMASLLETLQRIDDLIKQDLKLC
ncbi:MAG: 3-deoxy-8-phosphooctulonate synthase [Proteobacteria bacterium]|nr:3-deoxy-8-phosphooctulonate synthase [Pseudomonadota bacterium]